MTHNHPNYATPDHNASGCSQCAPSRDETNQVRIRMPDPALKPANTPNLVTIDGGSFQMGNHRDDGYPSDGETPVHTVRVDSFQIAPETVTNTQFAEFIAATGYRTEAGSFGWSFVFAGFLPEDFPETRGVEAARWWRQVYGAAWDHPEGPHSSIATRGNHPVTHVSWHDAMAFCAWSGTRLPAEAEWEFAARGGSAASHFWWGDQLTPNGTHRMNAWQGTFPARNSAADGYPGTAPVRSYEPNGYGLYNMTGNVWEWCGDWFEPGYYGRGPEDNPPGAESGTHRVMRGGSYLCHESYCNRHRVDSRSAATPDSSTGNTGFRVANSI